MLHENSSIYISQSSSDMSSSELIIDAAIDCLIRRRPCQEMKLL